MEWEKDIMLFWILMKWQRTRKEDDLSQDHDKIENWLISKEQIFK